MSSDTLFHKIYLASRKSISRVVSRIVPPHEIEDIVQETYVRMCQVENKEKISSPKSFMFKTARNLALDYQKQASVKLNDDIDDNELYALLSGDSDSDEMIENASTDRKFAHFCEAVRQLPVQCRKVFVLKKVYGHSQRDIAEQLDLSESTVEKHISTGMKRCTLFMRKI
ncbi:MAG: RNA polymerase sigma factor (sigma-70 family), partial [Phenylobacterium sp.]